MEIFFPSGPYNPLAARGSCGKKNCSAVLLIGGVVPVNIVFGGSGEPLIEDDIDFNDGDIVPWKYNNMIAYLKPIGFIIGRLNKNKDSYAIMGIREIAGRNVVTAVSIVLNLVFEIFNFKLALPEPLEFQLDSIEEDDHFVFRQKTNIPLISWLPRYLFSLNSPEGVHVTGPRLLEIDIKANEGDRVGEIEFTLGLDQEIESLSAIRGELIWFVHDPNDPNVNVLVGLVEETLEIRIPRNSFPEGRRMMIEVVGTRDSRHIWVFNEFDT